MWSSMLIINLKKRYGAPRMQMELKDLGIPCCLNHVAELPQQEGPEAHNGKNVKYIPTAYETSNVAENILNRNFTATKRDEKWVPDITYIDVEGEWMRLAVMQDYYFE